MKPMPPPKQVWPERMSRPVLPDLSSLGDLPKHEQEVLLRNAFRALDDDDSGEVEMGELLGVVQVLLGGQVSQKVATQLLQDMDVDQTGTVDFDEFCDFFRRVGDIKQWDPDAPPPCKTCKDVMALMLAILAGGVGALAMVSIADGTGTAMTTASLIGACLCFCLICLRGVVAPLIGLQIGRGSMDGDADDAPAVWAQDVGGPARQMFQIQAIPPPEPMEVNDWEPPPVPTLPNAPGEPMSALSNRSAATWRKRPSEPFEGGQFPRPPTDGQLVPFEGRDVEQGQYESRSPSAAKHAVGGADRDWSVPRQDPVATFSPWRASQADGPHRTRVREAAS
mmetsp:Transcript_38878/g.89035  ORF Transcript_38878/g.89035 Transcript_38878/m.89035 type:complete len:337 (-) Transcript_38878:219-1229(-)